MSTTNVTELRNELLQVFDGLREKTIEAKEAVEINNTAGKIISTVKLELANAALCGTTPNIPFLNAPTANSDDKVTLTASAKALAKGLSEAA